MNKGMKRRRIKCDDEDWSHENDVKAENEEDMHYEEVEKKQRKEGRREYGDNVNSTGILFGSFRPSTSSPPTSL